MKHILITTIAILLFAGCSDPEAEANKIFTKASQLVKESNAITEPYSLESFNKRKTAIELIEKIPKEYPSSSLSVKISAGDFKIHDKYFNEIKKNLQPDIGIQIAAKRGNIEAIKLHIAIGTDINFQEERGGTALHNAVAKGHRDAVTLLINKGADVNAISRGTPLHNAVVFGQLEMARLLISKGAEVNKFDYRGETPLDYVEVALSKTNEHYRKVLGQLRKLLIQNGAKLSKELKSGKNETNAF